MATATELPQKRVLVVDDSRFVRATFAAVLKAVVAVREEADGEAAWKAIAGGSVDRPRVHRPRHAEARRLRPARAHPRGRRTSASRQLPVVVISGSGAGGRQGARARRRRQRLHHQDGRCRRSSSRASTTCCKVVTAKRGARATHGPAHRHADRNTCSPRARSASPTPSATTASSRDGASHRQRGRDRAQRRARTRPSSSSRASPSWSWAGAQRRTRWRAPRRRRSWSCRPAPRPRRCCARRSGCSPAAAGEGHLRRADAAGSRRATASSLDPRRYGEFDRGADGARHAAPRRRYARRCRPAIPCRPRSTRRCGYSSMPTPRRLGDVSQEIARAPAAHRAGRSRRRTELNAMTTYREFHRRSLDDRDGFWRDEAKLVDWHRPFERVLDYSRPPFARWFVGGETNLCHNAVDRHLAKRAEQKALVWISTEVDADARVHLPRAACRGEPRRGDDALARREARRPRDHLHADDPRGGLRHARLRAPRRDPFGGVRRLRRGEPRGAHRRCEARADGHRRRRQPHGQDGPLQVAGRRVAQAREASAEEGADLPPRPGREHADRRRARRRLGDAARRTSRTRRSRAHGWNRTSLPTSSTPPARPASRRACSATSAATRSRSPRR